MESTNENWNAGVQPVSFKKSAVDLDQEPEVAILTPNNGTHLEVPMSMSKPKSEIDLSNVISMNLTPAATGTSSREPLQIIWRNLSYDVNVKKGKFCNRVQEKKRILHSMSGEIAGGTITALMGPSGAGKSTLLNCVSCKLMLGVDGDIFIRFPPRSVEHRDENTLRIGFVPQTDHLFTQFTVKETVMFASKMMNPGFTHAEHRDKMTEVLRSLDLEARANLKLKKLSGGQLKRASIAIELISNPKILILDEPTSGLDSDNSEMVISMLKNLSKVPGLEAPAIVATIHQPSVDVFMMFDSIYLLNRFGTNIYFGPPEKVMAYMESFGFAKRSDTNPADYMIEIANAKYGSEQFPAMADTARRQIEKPRTYLCHDIPLADLEIRKPNSFMSQFWLLMVRNFQAYVTKSATTFGKLMIFIFMAVAMTNIFQNPVGRETGCWTQVANLTIEDNQTEEDAGRKSFFDILDQKTIDFDISREISKLTEGTMYFFVIIMFYMFIPALTIVMAFPAELKTVSKEISNSWYSTTAYYFAKLISDYTILCICMFPAIVYSYIMSEQPMDLWRFCYLFVVVYMIAAIWQSRGVLFSIFFNKNETVALLCTLGLMYPTVFLSGFYVKVTNMLWVMRPFTYVSDMRRGFESMLAIMYGFGRCREGRLAETLFNEVFTQTSIMEMLRNFWSVFHVTQEDGVRLSLNLGLDDDYMNKLIDALNDYFGPYQEPDPDEPVEPSFMLKFYNVDQDSLYDNLIYLFLMFWATQIVIYIALRYNTRVNRL